MYYDTTENKTKVYSDSVWNDLGGGWDGILPNYTTAQRDALTPSTGMMIYNTDYDQIQTYTQTAWSGITGNKDIGIECASVMDCASGFCVDGVCCDTSIENCNGDCEACNLVGYMGTCTLRDEFDNTEVTSTCWYCNGTSDTSLTYTGESGVNCDGVTGFCYSGICRATYCDEDDDGYYAEALAYCPSGRYSLILGNDCDESDNTKYQNLTCYIDSDGDTYYSTTGTSVCSGTSCPSGYSGTVGTDCCDSDSRAYPGEPTYYSSTNNCGSWDYNCDGQTSKSGCSEAGRTCYVSNYFSCSPAYPSCTGSIGGYLDVGFLPLPPEDTCGQQQRYDSANLSSWCCGQLSIDVCYTAGCYNTYTCSTGYTNTCLCK